MTATTFFVGVVVFVTLGMSNMTAAAFYIGAVVFVGVVVFVTRGMGILCGMD